MQPRARHPGRTITSGRLFPRGQTARGDRRLNNLAMQVAISVRLDCALPGLALDHVDDGAVRLKLDLSAGQELGLQLRSLAPRDAHAAQVACEEVVDDLVEGHPGVENVLALRPHGLLPGLDIQVVPSLRPLAPDAAEIHGLDVHEAGGLQVGDVPVDGGDGRRRDDVQETPPLLRRELGAWLGGEVLDDEGAAGPQALEARLQQRGAVRNVQEHQQRHEVVKGAGGDLATLRHGDDVADHELHALGEARDALGELLAGLTDVPLQLDAGDPATALRRDVPGRAPDARADVQHVHGAVQAHDVDDVVVGLNAEVVVLV
mmetsp:Transcript_119354/g.380630  ORF Transcript_119354/g.380630 Transcript_119354/m.380630 type:complete len:318 (+) Transcript_119354:370-1323(+)